MSYQMLRKPYPGLSDLHDVCQVHSAIVYLEHGPDVFDMCGAGEGGRLVAHVLHEGGGRLRQLGHLLLVGLHTLLLTH